MTFLYNNALHNALKDFTRISTTEKTIPNSNANRATRGAKVVKELHLTALDAAST
jgi:hypothetical protein